MQGAIESPLVEANLIASMRQARKPGGQCSDQSCFDDMSQSLPIGLINIGRIEIKPEVVAS